MSANAREMSIVRNLQQAEAAEDLSLTQPREDANPAAEPIKEDKPLFKKPRKPKATDGTKAKKQTGAGAKSASDGKKQRASVKAASAKPALKTPKPKRNTGSAGSAKTSSKTPAKKPAAKSPKPAAPAAPKTPRKRKTAPATSATDAKSSEPAAPAAAEGAKLDQIIDMLVEMANARLRAGQAASSAANGAGSTSAPHSGSATIAEVKGVCGTGLPVFEGRVTGISA